MILAQADNTVLCWQCKTCGNLFTDAGIVISSEWDQDMAENPDEPALAHVRGGLECGPVEPANLAGRGIASQ